MADEELERITILLQARDKDLQRAFDRNNRLIAKATRQWDSDMKRTSKSVETQLAKMGRDIGGWSKAAVTGFAGTAITAAIGIFTTNMKQAVRSVAEIGNEAARSGLGTDAFQELSYVATQTRIPIDAMIDAMKELSLRADEFIITGKGPAAEAFARLGYGATELKEKLKEPEELMLDIIGRLEEMDDAAQLRISDEVFGGTGGERFVELISRGEDGLRAMMDEAYDMGVVLDENLIKRAQELNQRFDAVFAAIRAGVQQDVIPLAEAVMDVVDSLKAYRQQLSDGREVEQMADRERAVFESLNDAISEAFTQVPNDTLRGILRGDIEGAEQLTDALIDIRNAVEGYDSGEMSFDEMADAIGGAIDEARSMLSVMADVDDQRFPGLLSAINAIALAFANARAEAGMMASAAAAAPGSGVTMAPEGPVSFQLPPTSTAPTSSVRPQQPSVDWDWSGGGSGGGGRSGGGGGGSSRPSDWQRELDSTREAIAQLEIEAASLLVAAEYGTELGDAMEYARKRAELLYAAQQSGKEITPELTAEIDALAMSYMEAGLAAEQSAERLDAVRENAERGADAVADIFFSVLDGSKDAKTAVIELIAEILRMQALEGFRSLATSGGGGGFFGWLGGLLGSAHGNAFSAGSVVPFAKGGVFDVPTYFPMAGGRTGVLAEGLDDEAILPLGRGRDGKLGVRVTDMMTGRGQQTAQVAVMVESSEDLRVVAAKSGGAAAVHVVDGKLRGLAQAQRRSGV